MARFFFGKGLAEKRVSQKYTDKWYTQKVITPVKPSISVIHDKRAKNFSTYINIVGVVQLHLLCFVVLLDQNESHPYITLTPQ